MKAIQIFLLAGTSLAAATPALAQDAAADGVVADGDIIVTAQRRAESINDVGMAIQAVDAETLENLRVTDVRDLTAVAPSFTVSQSYQGVPTYTLRGIGLNTIHLSDNSTRSEERRGGKEGVSTGRSRWLPYHEKKKHKRQ